MSRLIVICGLPGTGKTTLAEALSKKLSIVCISKDSIKESLYEQLGLSTLEQSKVLGMQSSRLLLHLAESQIKNGVDLIIESPFNFPEDYSYFKNWIQRYQIKFMAIICTSPEGLRKKRFIDRPRHYAHHDHEREYVTPDESVYDKLPEMKLKLATDKPISELVKEIIDKLI